ncbi:putative 50 kDa protein in type I retrotransposable element R1DM [Lucilia cuprina]|nr:putative 50 kDa protein in type I retrotransposable element R1DM [Lucilia cuprina]
MKVFLDRSIIVPAVPAVAPRSASAVRRVPVVPATAAAVAPAANLPKPVETWSVVVKGMKGVTSKEVVDKVVKEVGPTLGVRVRELRPLRRSDGAVIRTPSVAEREKVEANVKFGEVGLEVSVNDKLGPKVVVQRVHPEITRDEFMGELHELNFRRRMTPEEYKRSVRLVSNPWKPTGGPVSVILEGNNEAMQQLLDNGRCYIKWFSFMVRPHDAVPSCFRCLGFDHRVRECRMTEGVCRLCGQVGHMASRCVNEIHCRNCAFKGLPSDHLMMSAACPVYSAMVARANARH